MTCFGGIFSGRRRRWFFLGKGQWQAGDCILYIMNNIPIHLTITMTTTITFTVTLSIDIVVRVI